MSLWLCVSIPTNFASPFCRNLAPFLEGLTLENIVFFLGKTTIFKKPLFFKKCPKEGPKWPQNLLRNNQIWPNKRQKCRKMLIFEPSKNILKKTPQKAPRWGPLAIDSVAPPKLAECPPLENPQGPGGHGMQLQSRWKRAFRHPPHPSGVLDV